MNLDQEKLAGKIFQKLQEFMFTMPYTHHEIIQFTKDLNIIRCYIL